MDDFKEIDKYRCHYYVNTPLYFKLTDGKPVLYKKAGDELAWERIVTDEVPDKLYIKDSDIKKSTEELFYSLSEKLQKEIDDEKGNAKKVAHIIEEIIENMFLNIESDSMSFAPSIIKKITKSYLNEPSVFREFAQYIKADDDLTYHSSRVLFYTLIYCYFNKMSLDEIRKFGLIGLFHAIGKVKIDKKITKKKERLTDDEFNTYKMYPKYSSEILSHSTNKEVKEVAPIVIKHKENENMTGFPYGIKMTDKYIEAVGIIESFEQLTSPRKKNMKAFEALKIIKDDVDKGKYNRDVFESFVKSLGQNLD